MGAPPKANQPRKPLFGNEAKQSVCTGVCLQICMCTLQLGEGKCVCTVFYRVAVIFNLANSQELGKFTVMSQPTILKLKVSKTGHASITFRNNFLYGCISYKQSLISSRRCLTFQILCPLQPYSIQILFQHLYFKYLV